MDSIDFSDEPECTSTTDSVEIPGCSVITSFISPEEELYLLGEETGGIASISNEQWITYLTRRVQHYGLIFNYRTLMLDYTTEIAPIPESLEFITNKLDLFLKSSTAETGEPTVPLTQLTINEYCAGQGIAPHIDTGSCFGEEIFILSIGSGIVMKMCERISDDQTQRSNSVKNKNSILEDDETNNNSSDRKNNNLNRRKKFVWLPARSLLILRGDARHKWSHGIGMRKCDKVNGLLIPRQRRVSFTFRQVLKPGNVPSSRLQSSHVEVDHVFKVYDNIALHWNHTRGKRKVYWHRVKDFIDNLPCGSLIADIGSGDGKYFGVNPKITVIGCDRSLKLLEVSHQPTFETFCCDAVSLPFKSNSFDGALCIAVLHHLGSVDRRIAVIRELLRICRPGGEIMIQAWALEQDEQSRHNFQQQDVFVPWKLQQRFFMEGQAERSKDVVSSIQAMKLENSVESSSNDSSSNFEKIINEDEETKKDIEAGLDKNATIDCEHVVKESDGSLIFQRYCHVYKRGELEDLCSSCSDNRIVESGWDKGNWFVRLMKIEDPRFALSPLGPSQPMPSSRTRL